MASPLSAELARRKSNTERVFDVFEANPSVWISWTVFSDLVGERAYRTRISNVKAIVTKHGGAIESRTRQEGRRINTEYRYLPQAPLGRDATVPAPERQDRTLFPLHRQA